MAEKTTEQAPEPLARQIEELKSDISNITRTLAQMERAGRASAAERVRERDPLLLDGFLIGLAAAPALRGKGK